MNKEDKYRNLFLNKFKENHSEGEVINYIEKVKDLDILVIGETIIDEYQYGFTLGKSGKSPIIAFQNEEDERYNGGVLAIRNHLREFVHKVDYYTDNIMMVKKRYIQDRQKLFETYSIKKNKYKSSYGDISEYDIVVIADFGHGFLTKARRNKIEEQAKFVSLNTQANAGNMGLNTINKYLRWDYISIDEHELRLATSNQFDSIKSILLDRFYKGIVTITKGSKGCTVFNNRKIEDVPFLKTQEKVVDPIGAGDALFSISSLVAYQNAPPEVIGFIGNLAGNIACSYPGNKYHVTKSKLLDNIDIIYD
jgi:bifunctional ADP-heptose synthase (sugar kinase/adenylyltransferase)